MSRLPRMAYRILRSNLGELTYPYRMTFAVTSRCQARCSMCNIWRRPAGDELSLSEVNEFMARSNHFSWINLTGGEIFLRDDIEAILDSIDRHSRQLCLLNFPTNGYDSDRILSVVRAFLGRMAVPRLMVTVSLDGPRDLHDELRGLPGSWDRALATFRQLRLLQSSRFSVYLGYTLQKANLKAFDDTMSAARRELGELALEEVHLNLAHVSGHYYDNNSFKGVPDQPEAAELLARIDTERVRGVGPVAFLEQAYQRLAQVYLKTGQVPLTCQAAAASCFIDQSGLVYPCTSYAKPLGSLREYDYDLYRLWRTEARQSIRKAVCDKLCSGCWTPCEAYQTILANLLKKSMFP